VIKRCALAILFGAAALSAFSLVAHAQHGGAPSERMALMPFAAVLRPDQKQLLYSMVKADRAKIESLHRRLHASREALIEKLLSGPTVDISKEVAELKAAQAAMIDERVSIALAVRKTMSSEQVKAAAEFHAKLEDLHRQESDLLRQMGGPTTGGEVPGEEGAGPDAGGK
jgi:hypothetical protein